MSALLCYAARTSAKGPKAGQIVWTQTNPQSRLMKRSSISVIDSNVYYLQIFVESQQTVYYIVHIDLPMLFIKLALSNSDHYCIYI